MMDVINPKATYYIKIEQEKFHPVELAKFRKR
jgi:hypothetical protein